MLCAPLNEASRPGPPLLDGRGNGRTDGWGLKVDILRTDECAGFQPVVWVGAVIPRGFLLVPASRIPRSPQATGRLHRLTPPTARRPVCSWLR
jgi:hypothetical protein